VHRSSTHAALLNACTRCSQGMIGTKRALKLMPSNYVMVMVYSTFDIDLNLRWVQANGIVSSSMQHHLPRRGYRLARRACREIALQVNYLEIALLMSAATAETLHLSQCTQQYPDAKLARDNTRSWALTQNLHANHCCMCRLVLCTRFPTNGSNLSIHPSD
jgi:hypothetical protein